MAVAVLTLPRQAQLSEAVLSIPVETCSSGAMHEAKRRRWAMYTAISRSLMIRILLVFLSVRILARMEVLNASRHM